MTQLLEGKKSLSQGTAETQQETCLRLDVRGEGKVESQRDYIVLYHSGGSTKMVTSTYMWNLKFEKKKKVP